MKPSIIILCIFVIMNLVACSQKIARIDQQQWQTYQARFILGSGRVVDTAQQGISHSEGQGIAMLLAVAFGDHEQFAKTWQWTQQHLQIRHDPLLAWRWAPAEYPPVQDENNATDGDLLVAWALLRAARQWHVQAYRREAQGILTSVSSQLIKSTPQGLVLMPGVNGFVHEHGLTVNLSYWVFPALLDFAREFNEPHWERLVKDGLQLLDQAGFGRWQLPPDWLLLHDKIEIATQYKPRFSYDAIRIPLYLIWAKQATEDRLRPYVTYWSAQLRQSTIPAWVDLKTDAVAQYNASLGIQAVMHLTRNRLNAKPTPLKLKRQAAWHDDQDYYSNSLALLSQVAATEVGLW